MRVLGFIALLLAAQVACSAPGALSDDELLDPTACAECHPEHYAQWAGSMHAYTGFDPLFVAQNRAYLADTGNQRPDYCVGCHSPVALQRGATTDGTDLDELPDSLRGVTCAACHLVEDAVRGHSAAPPIEEDGLIRGGISDVGRTPAHASGYSLLHDRDDPLSSELCGTCHCNWNPDGAHTERTYFEWEDSVFATRDLTRLTCGRCHMRGRTGRASTDESLPERRLHDHTWPGLDTALIDFPGMDVQAAEIQRDLDHSLLATLCVEPDPAGAAIVVRLENAGAGHSFPSGTSFDRRVWVELRAWQGDVEVLSSGIVGDDEPASAVQDPLMWLIRDRHLDAAGEPTDLPWRAAEVTGNLLEAAVTLDPTDPAFLHYQERRWPVYAGVPDRVEMRVRVRAIGLEVFEQLEQLGGLDPAIKLEQPTWEIGNTSLEWVGTGGPGDLGTCVN